MHYRHFPIHNVSVRTDICAFYSDWFMNRVREGFYDAVDQLRYPDHRIRRQLTPGDIFIFWTKNGAPMLPHLRELDERGYHYLWHYTLNGYPAILEPHVPPREHGIATIHQLVEHMDRSPDGHGPDRLTHRYDPVPFTSLTPAEWHVKNFDEIASQLEGRVKRAMVKPVKTVRPYVRERLRELGHTGIEYYDAYEGSPMLRVALTGIAESAKRHGMEVGTCREDFDMKPFGLAELTCTSANLIERTLGIKLPKDKHPPRDGGCRCYWGPDMGVENTCGHGCVYCYSTFSRTRAARHVANHDVHGTSLIGNGPHDDAGAAPAPGRGCEGCSMGCDSGICQLLDELLAVLEGDGK